MSIFGSLLVALVIDSLLGLIGVFSLYFNEKILRKITFALVAFAAGSMLGGAMLHMLPEAMEMSIYASEIFLFGFLGFFILERYIFWHHCHKGHCEIHTISYLTILGDGLHNFIDGLVIAAAFLVNVHLGWITFFAIFLHEVPQELGNFAILIHNGMTRNKAIMWTFLSQATCILGGLAGWFFAPQWMIAPTLAFAAGGFVYIAASDLVPEMHSEKDIRKATISFVLMMTGMGLLWAIKVFAGH